MMNQIRLKIADLHIMINSSQLPIHQEQDQAYHPFESGETGIDQEPDITIDLRVGLAPDVGGRIKIFEDDESWSVFQIDDEYLLSFQPAKHGKEPLWMARFPKDCSHVLVHCSEKLIDFRDGKQKLLNPVRYPLDQHLLMYHLSQKDGALIHAAGWEINGKGYIFPGRSGAGKSTQSRLFGIHHKWQGLSDDRMLVRKLGQAIWCYGTPWPGEEGIASNLGVNLAGIFFLCHGEDNKLRMIEPGEALKMLIPVVSIPWYDRETCLSMMYFCEDVLSQIPAYELSFRPTEEVVDFFEAFIRSENGLEA
jgi:hypothetical protein